MRTGSTLLAVFIVHLLLSACHSGPAALTTRQQVIFRTKKNTSASSLQPCTQTDDSHLPAPAIQPLSARLYALLQGLNSPRKTDTAWASNELENAHDHFIGYSTEQGLALSAVYCSYTDHQGQLWFGTSGGGA